MTEPVLRAMIAAGMDVARLNFSHGTYESHREAIELVRRLAAEAGQAVAIMQDLQGPKVRVGEIPDGPMELVTGQEVTLAVGERASPNCIPVTTPSLPRDVQPRDTILLDDGNLELVVEAIEGEQIRCQVVVGGPLTSHKGLNVPGVRLSVQSPTEKDMADLEFGVRAGVDWVALSFVREARDVLVVRRRLSELGADTPIMAKIEKREAVEQFDAILAEADGVMVARGDLAVEIGPEKVPMIQKRIIHACNAVGKPVVTATQMLNSMIDSPRPTRAEASDVANAILDLTDAVMLSAESAAGRYPVQAVQMMARIAMEVETGLPYHEIARRDVGRRGSPADAIARSTVLVAEELNAAALVAATRSGYTARMIARHRPRTPVLAITPNRAVSTRLAMVWGVTPRHVELPNNTDDIFRLAGNEVREAGLARPGERVVIAAAAPPTTDFSTNLLKVDRVPRPQDGNGFDHG